MVANHNGFFYTLDRETGKLLVAKPFIDGSNWAKEIGKDGRPIVLDNNGTVEKCLPDNHGGTNFQPPSFDPELGLFFVTAHETCATWQGVKPTEPIELGVRVPSGGRVLVDGRDQFSALRAIDPTTGQRRWEHKYRACPSSVALDLTGGVMSTASGLVFTGNNEGYFYAFEGATGKELWKFQVGAPVWGSAAVTYMMDGRQWAVMTAGLSFTAFALPAAPRSGMLFSGGGCWSAKRIGFSARETLSIAPAAIPDPRRASDIPAPAPRRDLFPAQCHRRLRREKSRSWS